MTILTTIKQRIVATSLLSLGFVLAVGAVGYLAYSSSAAPTRR